MKKYNAICCRSTGITEFSRFGVNKQGVQEANRIQEHEGTKPGFAADVSNGKAGFVYLFVSHLGCFGHWQFYFWKCYAEHFCSPLWSYLCVFRGVKMLYLISRHRLLYTYGHVQIKNSSWLWLHSTCEGVEAPRVSCGMNVLNGMFQAGKSSPENNLVPGSNHSLFSPFLLCNV